MTDKFDQFLEDLAEYLWKNTPDGFDEFYHIAFGSRGPRAAKTGAAEALGQLLDNLSVLSCADEYGLIAGSVRDRYRETLRFVSTRESNYESKGIRVPCYVKVACENLT